MPRENETHKLVREAYAEVAHKQSPCCGPGSSCCPDTAEASTEQQSDGEMGLSCGDPLAFGHLNAGDVVLDLGCGGGKDVFQAARKVGSTGRAIGVDMTPEMISVARGNAEKFTETTGLANVEFREGYIEDLPFEDGSVDVVISNCVINLSPNKPQVFREVYRVLKPGGRMIVSDIVLNRPLPESARSDADLYAACIAGALLRDEYLQAIRDAGFEKVEILSDNTYQAGNTCDDPITAGVSESLVGVAASITLLAVR